MFSEISSIRIEVSVSLKRMTPNTVPLTFLWHRFCSTDRKTFSFFSFVWQRSRLHAFFAFYPESKIIMRTLRDRGFKHCGKTKLFGVLVRGFTGSRRNRGPDRWWASCHHPRKARPRAECAWPALLGRESSARSRGCQNQWSRSRDWSPSDRQGTARTGESWEGRLEKYDTCAMNLLRDTWSHACMWHAWRCVKYAQSVCAPEKCACDMWVYVHLPSYALYSLLHLYETLKIWRKKFITPWPSCQKIFGSSSGFGECMYRTPFKVFRLHRSMSVLIFLAGTCSISWLFINHCEWRLLGFPRRASPSDRPS